MPSTFLCNQLHTPYGEAMNDDLEARAEACIEPGAFGYFAGGAGDERVLSRNVHAWDDHRLAPQVLVDVSQVDTTVSVLGRDRPHPVFVAPMAYQRHAHDEGEVAMGRAAASTGSVMTLSSQTTCDPADVAAAMGSADRWFQLYVFRDRAITDQLVAAARDGDYEALVLTVDFPVGGRRERDLRTGFRVELPTFVDLATGPLSPEERHAMHDPSLTWDDVAHFAAASGLPVLLKGILRPDDAERAIDAGAAGVIVSNHGGRQLDAVLPTAEALAPVVDAVAGRAAVLVDGGIRRGWDVARALALGADAVLVGRPVLWGLATGGQAGAQQVIRQILDELEGTLALVGCPRAADLDRSHLAPGPPALRWRP